MNRKELTNHALEVVFDGRNAAQSEVLNEYFQYTFRDESRECRPDMNVFHPQRQQGKQHDNSLLLIPSDVESDGKFVDVVGAEYLLELQSNYSPRVRVVALARIKHARNAVNVAKSELIVLEFRATAGQNNHVFRQF